MNDREMLELAAKAAGFGDQNGKFCWTESTYPRGSESKGALWNYRGWGDDAELWNPLTDDGDALRLAVKLGIDLHFEMQYLQGEEIAIAEVIFGWNDDGRCNCLMHSLDDDPAASVRRLITRAAAEIARAADAGGKD